MTHTESQPGLHAHSWNPEFDLIKRFRVDQRVSAKPTRFSKKPKPMGWLCRRSFESLDVAVWYAKSQIAKNEPERGMDMVFQIVDQSGYPERIIEVVS